MSERLNDEEIAEMENIAEAFLPSRGIDLFGDALAELRDRRAADLTDFERLALRCLHDRLVTDDMIDRAALAALDKILGGAR